MRHDQIRRRVLPRLCHVPFALLLVVGLVLSPLTSALTYASVSLSHAPAAGSTRAAVTAAADVPAVLGPQPFVTILCHFADEPYLPQTKAQWDVAISQLGDFWGKQSYGQISLTGSMVVGWYVLPQPVSYYANATVDDQLSRLMRDCTGVADGEVTFPDFAGINVVVNAGLFIARGGQTLLERDGQSKVYGATWTTSIHVEGGGNYGALPHEMGHAFGLAHIYRPPGATAGSQWDAMSIGSEFIAYHRDKLGWIPAGRKYVAPPDSSRTLTVASLGVQSLATLSCDAALMAQIPIAGSSTHFYTVERRSVDNFATGERMSGFVIHEVDTTRDLGTGQAQVVDTDGNLDPNDEGALWRPGETFVDQARGVLITVAAPGQVAIRTGSAASVPAPTQTFTLAETSGGTVNASLPSGRYGRGTRIELTATAQAGYAFRGWVIDGQLQLANPYPMSGLRLDTDHHVSAIFAPLASGYTATVTAAPGGSATVSPTSGPYPRNSQVTFAATPMPGFIFTGWTVNGAFAGWANPLVVDAGLDYAVTATFAALPQFPDVPATAGASGEIGQVAGRGIVRGYENGRFGPGDHTLRAQMAALIARAMGWEAETHGVAFPDQGHVDADLWRNVGTLAYYGVARGFGDGTYRPADDVLYAQAVSFITRAFVARGYWQPLDDDSALYPNVPACSGHRADIATFVNYAGPLPGTSAANLDWPDWEQPSTRAWFAQALWQALDSHFGR